jgi:hypothetical protein
LIGRHAGAAFVVCGGFEESAELLVHLAFRTVGAKEVSHTGN